MGMMMKVMIRIRVANLSFLNCYHSNCVNLSDSYVRTYFRRKEFPYQLLGRTETRYHHHHHYSHQHNIIIISIIIIIIDHIKSHQHHIPSHHTFTKRWLWWYYVLSLDAFTHIYNNRWSPVKLGGSALNLWGTGYRRYCTYCIWLIDVFLNCICLSGTIAIAMVIIHHCYIIIMVQHNRCFLFALPWSM